MHYENTAAKLNVSQCYDYMYDNKSQPDANGRRFILLILVILLVLPTSLSGVN